MNTLSCEYLHHSIYLAPNELRHCCKRFFYKGKMKGDVKIFDVNKKEDISSDKIISEKEKLHKKINTGVENECTGCPYLSKKNWGEINKKKFTIKHISIESTSVCSMKCTYCSEIYYGGLKPNYDVKETLDNLFKYKSKNSSFEFSWGGGEPTLLEDFENIFKVFTLKYKPTKNMIFSNALKYSPNIEFFLKKKLVTLVTSIDAGTPGMFKQIRGVRGINKVFSNLKKYYNNSNNNNHILDSNIIIKYIVTDENIDDNEIDSFINLIKEYGLEKCSFQLSSDFKKEKLNYYQTEKMIEFLVKLKNIGIKLVYFDYHSSPRIRNMMNEILSSGNSFKSKLVASYLKKIDIKNPLDVVIWGAGDTGRLIKNNNYFIKNNFIKIKYFVDKKLANSENRIGRHPIREIKTLMSNNHYILIASSAYYEEIYNDIISFGLDTDRILDQIYT